MEVGLLNLYKVWELKLLYFRNEVDYEWVECDRWINGANKSLKGSDKKNRDIHGREIVI